MSDGWRSVVDGRRIGCDNGLSVRKAIEFAGNDWCLLRNVLVRYANEGPPAHGRWVRNVLERMSNVDPQVAKDLRP